MNTSSTLAEQVSQMIESTEAEWHQKLQALESRVALLEKENEELQQEIEKSLAPYAEITDKVLRERLLQLGTSPLDTVMREAGVVLEHRLRQVAGDVGDGQHGAGLVDAVLAPGKGPVVFSTHPGEQDGVRMLFRGAMQFIRNPPMHRLMEYPESTANNFLRLIDALLQMLSENAPPPPGQVTLASVRLMLTRRRISKGQLALYKALYDAPLTLGRTGLLASELAQRLDIDRTQLAGVLGALGRRINQTEGLGDKGGITIVFDITEAANGEWHYCMRPILCQALEAEKLV